MYPDLKGKTVVVTGASAGLGKRIAQRFLEAGSRVVLVGRSVITWLTDTDRDNCEYIQCDIRDTAPVEHWLNEWEKEGGTVHVLVNNAGVIEEGALLGYSQEAWESTFDVNLRATFRMCQLFANHMRDKQGCSIVNAASYAATLPAANSGVYAASKAALVSLTRTMAAEWAPYGIRVNAYSPGVVRTPMTEPKLKEHESTMLEAISLNRLGTADEIANVVLFLSSSVSAYITGTNIDASGGKLIIQNPRAAWTKLTSHKTDSDQ